MEKEFKTITVQLDKDSPVTEQVIRKLDGLFEIAPPEYLKKSLTSLFFSYLSNIEPEDYLPEIKEIATDIHCLMEFLEVVEPEQKEDGL